MTQRRRFTAPERLVLIALAMILVQLIFRGWATAGSWFYSDDFIFLGTTAHGDADTGWLLHPHNVHFMPFGLLLAKFVGSVGTFNWFLAATQIIVMQAIASLLCWWMLRKIFGDRPGVLIALGFYLFGSLTFPTVVWWAAALNQLPHQIALFGAIGAHVAYLRTRHPSQAVVATLFLTLGFASYSKTVLIPMVLLALTILYFANGGFFSRCKQTVIRYWHAWVLYGALTIGYLVMYVIRIPGTKAPSLDAVLGTLNLSITQAFGSAIAGGPWHWDSLLQAGGVGPRLFVATPMFFVMASWVVLATLWGYQALRYRRALWPLYVLVPYLVLSGLLIATGRAGAFGVGPAALELRYLADLGAIGALCIGLATMPVLGAHQSLELRSPATTTAQTPKWLKRTVVGAFLVGSVVSSIGYAMPWHDANRMPQREYIANADQALKSGGIEVPNLGVPNNVLWSVAYPANLVSQVLAPFGDKFNVVSVGTDLRMFDSSGHLDKALISGDPRTQPGPEQGCGYPVSIGPETIDIAPVFNFPFWMTISYLAGSDGIVTVAAGETSVEVPIEKGLHTAFLMTEGAYDAATITPLQGVSLCIDNINVGQLAPQGAS